MIVTFKQKQQLLCLDSKVIKQSTQIYSNTKHYRTQKYCLNKFYLEKKYIGIWVPIWYLWVQLFSVVQAPTIFYIDGWIFSCFIYLHDAYMCYRIKSGYPGYLVVFNTGSEEAPLDIKQLRQVPEELTVLVVRDTSSIGNM